jgi:hypothetical protein
MRSIIFTHFSSFGDRLIESAEGAKCNSLGQRPRNPNADIGKALKARNAKDH